MRLNQAENIQKTSTIKATCGLNYLHSRKNRFTKDFADSELRWIYPSASTTKRSVFQQRHHGSDDAVVHVLWTHQLEGKPWDLAQKRANNLSSVLQSHANLIFQLGLLAPAWRSKTHEGIEESNLFEGLKRARNISFYLHSLELWIKSFFTFTCCIWRSKPFPNNFVSLHVKDFSTFEMRSTRQNQLLSYTASINQNQPGPCQGAVDAGRSSTGTHNRTSHRTCHRLWCGQTWAHTICIHGWFLPINLWLKNSQVFILSSVPKKTQKSGLFWMKNICDCSWDASTCQKMWPRIVWP